MMPCIMLHVFRAATRKGILAFLHAHNRRISRTWKEIFSVLVTSTYHASFGMGHPTILKLVEAFVRLRCDNNSLFKTIRKCKYMRSHSRLVKISGHHSCRFHLKCLLWWFESSQNRYLINVEAGWRNRRDLFHAQNIAQAGLTEEWGLYIIISIYNRLFHQKPIFTFAVCLYLYW